ncbi:uncharacterized protein [Aquarana catesbeiana]|uniref:uncharacterized protein isoform X1 n=1 Tax=Aquarana catesbeiana TaxID=8400 RepID=UPI003CC978F6
MKMVALCVLMSCLSVCLGYGSDCSTFIKGPLTVEQSVGKWSLMAVAHEINETIISDVGLEHAFMEVYLKNGVPHLTHLSIRAGMVDRFEMKDLAIKDGYLTYTSKRFGSKPAFRSISDDCALYSFQNPLDIHFFYCRSNRPSIDDFRKIIKYSDCHNYQHIVIRRDSGKMRSQGENQCMGTTMARLILGTKLWPSMNHLKILCLSGLKEKLNNSSY